ncbi:GNAT family N-acetyltransferase [Aeromicrobium sp.]|uniref:GNAT family N-acetyltransferase n=1 Tax=Aeromicrobium sp. TaxID=1871063 RepID=UPI0030C1CB92
MIRVARSADVETIVDIELACFGASAWSESDVRAEVDAEHRLVLIEGGLRAYGAISVVGEVADLDRIAVLPGARGGGLARDLLAELIGSARQRAAARMLLEVAADNGAALGLYASLGFATINRRARYYTGGVDALVMELDIEEQS